METTTKLRNRSTKSWAFPIPCQVDASSINKLCIKLREKHNELKISVLAQLGSKDNLSLDELFDSGMWGRIERVGIFCSGPELVLWLINSRGKRVILSWESPKADESAFLVQDVCKHWFNPLLIPSYIDLGNLLIIIFFLWFLLLTYRQKSELQVDLENLVRKQQEIESVADPDQKVKQLKAIEDSKKNIENQIRERSAWRTIASLAFYFFAGVLAAVIIIQIPLIRKIIIYAITPYIWIIFLYNKTFPAFHFDFNSAKGAYYSDRVRYAVIVAMVTLLTTIATIL